MNKQIILIWLVISIVFSCKKKDPCDDLVNGVYQFPELPEKHDWTREEIDEFWDLPEDVCNCITTVGLIETCLNYPNLRLIMAGSNPQSGYEGLVKARFRGIRELETRPDRGIYLLKKYQTIDPLGYDPTWEPVEIGAYNFSIYYFEIIFSQYANLETLTNEEKIKLIETTIVVYEKMKGDLESYSFFGLECTTALAGRLMYLNNYSPFEEAYNDNWLVRELIDFYGPVNPETVEFVYNLSKEFLQNFKNE